MKSEELTALGLTEEQSRQVLALNGRDIEKHKNSASTLQTRVDELTSQLAQANTKLEGFDPDWKEKAEQAQAQADAKVHQLEFDYALTAALTGAKARNTTAVKALLNMDGLKLSEGNIIGLKEQLDKLKSENDYLFESETPAVRITAQTNGAVAQGDTNSKINDALRAALGKNF